MARLIVVVACSLLLVAGVNASCFLKRGTCDPGLFWGEIPGVSLKCYDCNCNKAGTLISCCMNIPIPVGYNTRKCIRTLDENTCTYRVTKLKNPNRECAVNAWSG